MKTTMSIDYVAKEFCNTNMIWRAVYPRRILTIEDVEKIIKLFRIMRNTLWYVIYDSKIEYISF
jgi:hypothetical protein